ncbi:MAG: hypothetical protein ACETWQ_03290 [Phycisphaerae bacterium]
MVHVKVRSKSRLFFAKLSEVDRKDFVIELPELCHEIHRSEEGKRTCRKVLEHVKQLLPKVEGMPFVFCCCWALKILVIPTSKEDAYLVFTRSPAPDYKHLRYVAKVLKSDVYDVKRRLWDPVKSLRTEFVQEVVERLKEDRWIDSSFDGKTIIMKALGSAYDQRYPYDVPAFDVVIYNVLEGSALDKESNEGRLRIAASARNGDKAHVVRVIIKTVGSNPEKFEVPIVGLVMQNSDARSDSLGWSLAHNLGDTLLGEWVERKRHSFTLSGTRIWNADVGLYLNGDLETRLRQRTERLARVGLDMANNSVRSFLMEELQTRTRIWENFKKWLNDFHKATIFPMTGIDGGILWSQILEDLNGALNSMSAEHAGHVLRTMGKVVVDDILGIPEQYSPLVPAIKRPTDEERVNLLRRDLLGNGSKYKIMLDGKFVAQTLEESEFNKDLLAYYVRSYPDATAEALLHATGSRHINLDEDPGKNAWYRFFEFCEKEGKKDIIERTEASLYKTSESAKRQRVLNMYAELAGVFWKSLTFGATLGYSVIGDIRRRAYRRYRTKHVGIAGEAGNGH